MIKRAGRWLLVGCLIAAIVGLLGCSEETDDDFDHDSVAGEPCVSCHNGVNSTGKPDYHYPTTDLCDACHGTEEWDPLVAFDHNQVLGACYACHNNVDAQGKTATHINSTNTCDACHYLHTWAPTYTVDHTEVMGSCSSCHNNVIAYGKPPNHIPTAQDCGFCHTVNSWL